MNNKDKIEHIMALHNGELGVTWEDPDVVTPDTIAKLDQLIQDERKEAVEKYRQQLNAYWPEGSEEPTLSSDQTKETLAAEYGIELPAGTKNQRKLLRNAVRPEVGLHILAQLQDSAKEKKTNSKGGKR